MKRLVSLFLALAMVFTMSAALAEVTYPLTTEPVTHTIHALPTITCIHLVYFTTTI